MIRLPITRGLLLLGALCLAGPATAQTEEQLGAQILDGCSSELTQYCAAVTPGEGRLLACLYAHGDKLSGQCEMALYDAAVRLERAINAITYVASECRAEIQTHCASVEPGQGRIAQCLVAKAAQLSPGCDEALTTVGLKWSGRRPGGGRIVGFQ